MSSFEDREKGHEKKFVMDEEKAFKVTARRNRLFGLWAADLKGLKGEDAEAYAKEVIYSDFELPGDEDILGKVRDDLKAAGIVAVDKDLRIKLNEYYQQAYDHVANQNS